MTTNKKTVQKYMDGFNATDHEMILSCLTDDVRWEMPGHFKVSGKEAFDKEIENENFTGSPIIGVTRMVEENEVVIAEGTVKCQLKTGVWLDLEFCDVFHMREGKIALLKSYVVAK